VLALLDGMHKRKEKVSDDNKRKSWEECEITAQVRAQVPVVLWQLIDDTRRAVVREWNSFNSFLKEILDRFIGACANGLLDLAQHYYCMYPKMNARWQSGSALRMAIANGQL